MSEHEIVKTKDIKIGDLLLLRRTSSSMLREFEVLDVLRENIPSIILVVKDNNGAVDRFSFNENTEIMVCGSAEKKINHSFDGVVYYNVVDKKYIGFYEKEDKTQGIGSCISMDSENILDLPIFFNEESDIPKCDDNTPKEYLQRRNFTLIIEE